MADGIEMGLRQQLEMAQAVAHMGSWQWDLATGVVTWSDELYRIYGLAPQAEPITLESFLARVHVDERARIQREIEAAMTRRGRFAYREVIVRPTGELRTLDTIGEVLVDAGGNVTGLFGTCRDITEEKAIWSAEILVEGERRVLAMLAENAPMPAMLAAIIDTIEAVAPSGTVASILLLDADGMHIRHGAAPRLSEAFTRAIDGAPIGPKAGSCGTAAFRREPVFVADVETDPLWDDYRHHLRSLGLRSCWSWPILSSKGRVLGTFALYHPEARLPDPGAREQLERAAHVTRLVLERRALDEQLGALAARVEAIREDERTRIARDLHDQLGQALTAFKLDLGWLGRRTQDAALTKKLDDMGRSTDELLQAVRRIAADLRPGMLDEIGLRAAIEWQAEEFERRFGITCTVRSNIGDLRLERELATMVFRVFQESLTNVARHASARVVEVALLLERGTIKLDIADDGIGIPEVGPRGSTLGILGMGERARRLGGECTVKRRAPTGTIVTVSVPLRLSTESFGVGS